MKGGFIFEALLHNFGLTDQRTSIRVIKNIANDDVHVQSIWLVYSQITKILCKIFIPENSSSISLLINVSLLTLFSTPL